MAELITGGLLASGLLYSLLGDKKSGGHLGGGLPATEKDQLDAMTKSVTAMDQGSELSLGTTRNPAEGAEQLNPFIGAGNRLDAMTPAGKDSRGVPLVRSLTGDLVPADKFQHNNMVPFFGGSVKQNVGESVNESILANQTGVGTTDIAKTEQKPFFDQMKPFGTPTGMASFVDEQQARIWSGNTRDNEVPFERVHVAPGLGGGQTATGSGGFQQADTLDQARAQKNVDELRVKTNPKISQGLGGLETAPGAVNQNRGLMGEMRKQAPDRFYVNENGERNLITTGEFIKPRISPNPVDRQVNRPETNRAQQNPAGPAVQTETYQVPTYRDDHNTPLGALPLKPAHAPESWNTITEKVTAGGAPGDYGRGAVRVTPNERSRTETRNHVLNVSSAVQGIITPILDFLRPTKKQNAIGNIRQTGNVTGPRMNPAYDPNEIIARTTIKEQTSLVDYRGIATGKQTHGYVFDPAEQQRAAPGREELADYYQTGAAKVVDGVERGAYPTMKWIMPGQNRDTDHVPYSGVAGSEFTKPRSVTAERGARLNTSREPLSRGRAPAVQGAKVPSGQQAVHVQHRKITTDYLNDRDQAPTDVKSCTPHASIMGQMNVANRPNIDVANERNTFDAVAQFHNNPQTPGLL